MDPALCCALTSADKHGGLKPCFGCHVPRRIVVAHAVMMFFGFLPAGPGPHPFCGDHRLDFTVGQAWAGGTVSFTPAEFRESERTQGGCEDLPSSCSLIMRMAFPIITESVGYTEQLSLLTAMSPPLLSRWVSRSPGFPARFPAVIF